MITSPEAYFGAGGDPGGRSQVWEGGLGIWGAVALGGLGAWIGCRRAGVRLPPLADALAPGIVLAQAVGRWGNWFNNELYGRATDLPWGLTIDQWDSAAGRAVETAGRPVVVGPSTPPSCTRALWDLGAAGLLVWADRRFRLGHGRVFALYVAVYCLGRGWIEALRIDQAHRILGLRLNLWTSLVVLARRRRLPGVLARGCGRGGDSALRRSGDRARAGGARPPADAVSRDTRQVAGP